MDGRFATQSSSAWGRSVKAARDHRNIVLGCIAGLLIVGGPLAFRGLFSHVRTAAAKRRRAADAADFQSSARPILCSHCIFCHNDRLQNGETSFEHRSTMVYGGRLGPAILSGDPEHSLLVHAIRRDGRTVPMMPPGPSLSVQDIDTMVRWIRRGAPWGMDPIGCKELQPFSY